MLCQLPIEIIVSSSTLYSTILQTFFQLSSSEMEFTVNEFWKLGRFLFGIFKDISMKENK